MDLSIFILCSLVILFVILVTIDYVMSKKLTNLYRDKLQESVDELDWLSRCKEKSYDIEMDAVCDFNSFLRAFLAKFVPGISENWIRKDSNLNMLCAFNSCPCSPVKVELFGKISGVFCQIHVDFILSTIRKSKGEIA